MNNESYSAREILWVVVIFFIIFGIPILRYLNSEEYHQDQIDAELARYEPLRMGETNVEPGTVCFDFQSGLQSIERKEGVSRIYCQLPGEELPIEVLEGFNPSQKWVIDPQCKFIYMIGPNESRAIYTIALSSKQFDSVWGRRVEMDRGSSITSFAISPSGNKLVVGLDRSYQIWELKDGKLSDSLTVRVSDLIDLDKPLRWDEAEDTLLLPMGNLNLAVEPSRAYYKVDLSNGSVGLLDYGDSFENYLYVDHYQGLDGNRGFLCK